MTEREEFQHEMDAIESCIKLQQSRETCCATCKSYSLEACKFERKMNDENVMVEMMWHPCNRVKGPIGESHWRLPHDCCPHYKKG